MRETRAAVGTTGEEELIRSRASCAGIRKGCRNTGCGVRVSEHCRIAYSSATSRELERTVLGKGYGFVAKVLYPLGAQCTQKKSRLLRKQGEDVLLVVAVGIPNFVLASF